MDIFKSYKKCSILGVYERKMRNIRKTNDAILEISATVEEKSCRKHIPSMLMALSMRS